MIMSGYLTKHPPVILNPALVDPRRAEREREKAALGEVPVLPQPESAGVMTKARRLVSELRTWIKAGAQVPPLRIAAARLEACNSCEYWAKRGNLGLGECKVPGCGCTRAKVLLATSKCPHPKGSRWPA